MPCQQVPRTATYAEAAQALAVAFAKEVRQGLLPSLRAAAPPMTMTAGLSSHGGVPVSLSAQATRVKGKVAESSQALARDQAALSGQPYQTQYFDLQVGARCQPQLPATYVTAPGARARLPTHA